MSENRNPIEELKAVMEEKQKAFEEAKNAFEKEFARRQAEAEEKKEKIKNAVKEVKRNDQQEARLKKMNDLAESGIDPFGQAFTRTALSSDIFKAYSEKTREELEELVPSASIAGRIMSKRRMGKIGFMHLQDKDGRIQVVVKKQVVGEEDYELFKQSDVGDIIGVSGNIIKTQSGELSVEVHEYTHLTKAEIASHGKDLKLDYSETWSCYKGGEHHCGVCGTCRERKEALAQAGIEDNTIYEN